MGTWEPGFGGRGLELEAGAGVCQWGPGAGSGDTGSVSGALGLGVGTLVLKWVLGGLKQRIKEGVAALEGQGTMVLAAGSHQGPYE